MAESACSLQSQTLAFLYNALRDAKQTDPIGIDDLNPFAWQSREKVKPMKVSLDTLKGWFTKG